MKRTFLILGAAIALTSSCGKIDNNRAQAPLAQPSGDSQNSANSTNSGQEKIDYLNGRLTQMQAQVTQLTNQMDTNQQDYANQVAALTSQFSQLNTQFEQAQADLSKQSATIANLQAQIAQLQALIAQLQSQLAKLQTIANLSSAQLLVRAEYLDGKFKEKLNINSVNNPPYSFDATVLALNQVNLNFKKGFIPSSLSFKVTSIPKAYQFTTMFGTPIFSLTAKMVSVPLTGTQGAFYANALSMLVNTPSITVPAISITPVGSSYTVSSSQTTSPTNALCVSSIGELPVGYCQ